MKPTILPKEIIRFSLESHYSRFSKQSKIAYLLVIAMVLGCLAALPLVNIEITVQSRGMIRSRIEPTGIQTPVTGQVQQINITENRKVTVGDTLICLAPEKIGTQLRMLDDKIGLYSGAKLRKRFLSLTLWVRFGGGL